jgi:hypothetical protein
MRAYPIDSPQAAARLLAMALVADGHCALSELKALDRMGACERLGLTAQDMTSVIDHFIEDLMVGLRGDWHGSARLTHEQRTLLLDDIRDPSLRAEVHQLCEALVQADGHRADGEEDLLAAMAWAWREQPSHTLNANRLRS